MTTNTIDHLFLELSQFTQATTAKELRLQQEVAAAQDAVRELCGTLGNLLQTLGTPASDIEIRNARDALTKHAPKEKL